jgi:hypothetical protein
VISGLLRDEVDGPKAGKVGYLANILIGAIERDALEKRVEVLEENMIQRGP